MADLRTKEGKHQARLARAAAAWPGGTDPVTRQRTAMLIAAALMDEYADKEHRDLVLAEWLRLAHPDHARDVATGVAAHALRRCLPVIWDVLMIADAADQNQAGDWYAQNGDFVWSPQPGWLVD